MQDQTLQICFAGYYPILEVLQLEMSEYTLRGGPNNRDE